MKCIIIDDEPLAIDVLEEYCKKMDFLEVVGCFTNPLDAISTIKEKKIDLIFIDIEMPQINGIDFINSLDNKPLFIFTTAYSQYAIEGFDLNALDYLVKPIPYQRFIKAVSRAKELHAYKDAPEQKPQGNVFSAVGEVHGPHNFIFVKAEYENVKILKDDIKYIQGLKDYLKIHIASCNKPILTLMSFKEMSDRLPQTQFLRAHKSFTVNVGYIRAIQRNKIIIGDVRIPIGESYKSEFFMRLGLK
ncbi:MAG: LytTR family DNA-binding domain-containing protein [Sediminicola sp.]|tara:strand:- start:26114 stop:26851 length:738 start_codon:yes stop_codon:yes gene_type:complete